MGPLNRVPAAQVVSGRPAPTEHVSGSGKTSIRAVPLTPQTDAAQRFVSPSLMDPPFAGYERDAAFGL